MKIEEVNNFKSLNLFARQLVEGFITGKHKSPYHGFSVEFAEHRLYNTGESTKDIDWRVFARTDRLYTKRYEEETNLRSHIIIDHSSSMYYPEKSFEKMKFAVYGAASLSYLLFKQRDAFSLTTFSDTVSFDLPSKTTGAHFELFLRRLEELKQEKQQGQSNVAENLNKIVPRLHNRSLVIIFSDMFDDHSQLKDILYALRHFRYHQHEVLVFQINHHQSELMFDFDNQPHEFIDIETGEKAIVNPALVKENFSKKIESYYNELKITCGQMKIDLVELNTQDDLEHILLEYLIKRSQLQKK